MRCHCFLFAYVDFFVLKIQNWTMIFRPGKIYSGNPAHLQKTKVHRLSKDGLNGCEVYGMLKKSTRVSAIQAKGFMF